MAPSWVGMSSVSFPWSHSHMRVAFPSCLQLQVAQTILLCHTLVFICHPPLYRVFGLFSVHVSYCVVFYFPVVQSSGYIPFFMFALWNSTTAVLASVCSGIKLKALGLNRCFVCDWAFPSSTEDSIFFTILHFGAGFG
jgi:hypothetical protein